MDDGNWDGLWEIISPPPLDTVSALRFILVLLFCGKLIVGRRDRCLGDSRRALEILLREGRLDRVDWERVVLGRQLPREAYLDQVVLGRIPPKEGHLDRIVLCRMPSKENPLPLD